VGQAEAWKIILADPCYDLVDRSCKFGLVCDLADALEAGGEIKVWLDEREIDYGENIVLRIADGPDADFVLLILSPDAVDSTWVKEEWTDAYWATGKPRALDGSG
jgi:hypothetical protein